MTIIFSEANDQSTNYVIDWLSYYKIDFIRDNGNNEISLTDYAQLNFSHKIATKTSQLKDQNLTDSSQKDIIWFRRPYKGVENLLYSNLNNLEKFSTYESIKNNLNNHNSIFKKLFINKLEKNSNHIGNFEISSLNKPDVLEKASSLGLKIPTTLITNSKAALAEFLKENKKIISKPLYEVIVLNKNNYSFISLTHLIDNLRKIPNEFSPSLFQTYVDKLYEVRTFYFKGAFYSMAIFSQKNKKTQVDFRDYDNEKANRMVPYKLSKSIEGKLKKLMEALNLDNGSIDLIKGKDLEYYFLEINPVGQFDFLSKSCNYNLEKKIADFIKTNQK